MSYSCNDELYMKEALKQAEISYLEEEVPVGAVIVHHDRIVSKGRNRRENTKNALHHAEIEAIYGACKELQRWRLYDCCIYVTLEPCPMCAGAIINSRIDRVVFSVPDFKSGAFGSVINLNNFGFNFKPELVCGVLENSCRDLITNFFKHLREIQKNTNK